MRTEVGPVKAPQAQTLVLTQAPLSWQAPGAVFEGVACPPPQPLAAAPVVPAMASQVVGVTQACDGGWSQGLPPPAPPPAPLLAYIVAPGNAGPWPQGAHAEGSLAPSQVKAPPDDSCNPKSVYENFRLWQHYKPLARRHLPQSPDTEVLSCFFTFLEFKAEEETQIQKSQWMKGPQCLPPPALPRLEPQGLPAPEVVKQPVYLPSKAGPKAPPACLSPPRPQRPAETKAPEEMPPEVVEEYKDIIEELLGPPAGAKGELKGQWEEGEVEQEGDEMLLDPGVLSYVDNLCSQKDFVTKVEAVIHPRFLEELLSPDPQMDFLALSQELEQEEGLTLAQVQKSCYAFGEIGFPLAEGCPARLSSPGPSGTRQRAQRDGQVQNPRCGFEETGFLLAEGCPARLSSPGPSGTRQRAQRDGQVQNPRCAFGETGFLLAEGCPARLSSPGPSGTRQRAQRDGQVQNPRCAFGETGFPLAEGCPARLSSPGPSGTRQRAQRDGQVQNPRCAFGETGFPLAEGCPARLSSPGPSGTRQRAQRDGQVQNPHCAFGETGFPLAEGCPARLSSPGPSGKRAEAQRDGQVQNPHCAFGETGFPLAEGCPARLSSPGPSGTRQRAQRDGQVQNPRCAFGESGFPLAEGCPARLSSPGPSGTRQRAQRDGQALWPYLLLAAACASCLLQHPGAAP
ncbi:NUT family member 2D [Plecturocebus cupreus]